MENFPPSSPPVVKWYRAYATFMTVLYLGIVILLAIFLAVDGLTQMRQDIPDWFFYIYMIFIFGLTGMLGIAYLVSFFIPNKSWAWVYHLVLICIGLTSPCCLPASLPLMIFWFKPETKAWFGRG